MGQQTAPKSGLEKVMDRTDIALSIDGLVTSSVSGVEKRDADVVSVINGTTYNSKTNLTISPTSTAGGLFTLRYIKAPLLGFEFNYSYARYTQNYAFNIATTPNPPTAVGNAVGLSSIQTNVAEETLGYVAHLHKFLGVKPFLGAGGGTIRFKPTPNGGEGLNEQYRAVYYYNVGADDELVPHFGMRVAFRQLIYLAPDFGQNFLTITRRPITTEPTFGFYLRF
jgi:hypothetical protein